MHSSSRPAFSTLRKGALLCALLGTFATASSAGEGSFALLSESEVQAYHLHPTSEEIIQDTRSISLQKNDGPAIQVASPSGFKLSSPVDFDIRIQPKNGIPVNMATLKIEYRLGPIWTDVTRRLAGHGSVVGTRLRAAGADLPRGNHKVRLTVRDSNGRVTSAVVSFSVVN